MQAYSRMEISASILPDKKQMEKGLFQWEQYCERKTDKFVQVPHRSTGRNKFKDNCSTEDVT